MTYWGSKVFCNRPDKFSGDLIWRSLRYFAINLQYKSFDILTLTKIAAIQFVFERIHTNFGKIEIIVNLELMEEILLNIRENHSL